MSTNRVTVILDGVDKLSPMLSGLRSSTMSLGAGATFLGNMYTKAFEAASAGLGSMMGRFTEASDMQQSVIKLAGQFGAMTGKDYEYGTALIKDLNKEFSTMAAALPGSTQDFKDLGLAISDTLIKSNSVNGVFNEDAFKAQALSLTKTLGLLKDPAAGILNSDIQLFFTKFAEGASESELRILKLNERMPGLMGELEKASVKLFGQGKKIEDLSLQQRVKIFEVATKALSPDAMIRDLETTAGSQIEAFKTTLFDQDTGVFGFLREITKENGKARTVMDSFGSLLSSVLGENGLFAEIGEKLSMLGIKGFDPMKLLYDGVMTVTSWIKGVTSFLDLFGQSDLTDMISGFNLSNVTSSIGTYLSGLGNNFVSWVRGLFSSAFNSGVFLKLGGILAQGINAGVAWATAAISTVDYSNLGKAAADVAVALTQSIAGFILSIDYLSLANYVGQAFLAILQFGKAFTDGLREAFFNAIGQAAGAIGSWVSGKISEFYNSVVQALTGFIDTIKNKIIEGLDAAKNFNVGNLNPLNLLPGNSKPVGNQASGLNVGGLFNAIGRELSAMPSTSDIVVANSSEAILNRGQQSQLIDMVRSSRGGVPVVAQSPRSMSTSEKPNFAPIFNVYPSQGMDEESLVSSVMNKIERSWSRYNESYLAT